MSQTAQHAITTYVSDMLALARHNAIPLDAQAQDEAVAQLPATATLIPRIKQTLDRQVERLNAHLDQLGGHEASGIKSAVSSVLGAGAAAIDKSRKTRVSKYLRDDQTALALMTISYTMLHTTAVGLSDQATAELALQSLQELTPLVVEINRAVPAAVIAELQAEGLPVDTAAIESSRDSTQKAWN